MKHFVSVMSLSASEVLRGLAGRRVPVLPAHARVVPRASMDGRHRPVFQTGFGFFEECFECFTLGFLESELSPKNYETAPLPIRWQIECNPAKMDGSTAWYGGWDVHSAPAIHAFLFQRSVLMGYHLRESSCSATKCHWKGDRFF